MDTWTLFQTVLLLVGAMLGGAVGQVVVEWWRRRQLDPESFPSVAVIPDNSLCIVQIESADQEMLGRMAAVWRPKAALRGSELLFVNRPVITTIRNRLRTGTDG